MLKAIVVNFAISAFDFNWKRRSAHPVTGTLGEKCRLVFQMVVKWPLGTTDKSDIMQAAIVDVIGIGACDTHQNLHKTEPVARLLLMDWRLGE